MRVRYSFSSRRTRTIDPTNRHKIGFPKVVLDVIRISDVVLEILDARFIEKTRNIPSENLVKELGKKLIYVINKADLAVISEIKEEVARLGLEPYVIISSKSSQGRKNLRDKIKIEVKRLKVTHAKAHVGIIGYPNTGKSTLINVLAGGGRSKVSSESGFTKGMHKIRFSKDILILDTPGIIADKDAPATQKENISKTAEIGVKNYTNVKDPYVIVVHLMRKHAKAIESFYDINSEGDSEVLVEKLGRKRNVIKKGNIVDVERVSRIILKDWQAGIIK